MAQPKYDVIFQELRKRIEAGSIGFQELLPSENTLAREFVCTRNTVRKAIALLVTQGFVQTMQGRGAQVIYRRHPASVFMVGGIESMREAAERNRIPVSTHMISLDRTTVDADLASRSGMSQGARVTVVRRLRLLDGVPLIVDTSCFLSAVVPDLTQEIVESSVYAYLEHELGVNVASATRTMTVERASDEDRQFLHLAGMDCVAVITSTTFDSSGTLFEYTSSRHSPVHFEFQAAAHRLPQNR